MAKFDVDRRCRAQRQRNTNQRNNWKARPRPKQYGGSMLKMVQSGPAEQLLRVLPWAPERDKQRLDMATPSLDGQCSCTVRGKAGRAGMMRMANQKTRGPAWTALGCHSWPQQATALHESTAPDRTGAAPSGSIHPLGPTPGTAGKDPGRKKFGCHNPASLTNPSGLQAGLRSQKRTHGGLPCPIVYHLRPRVGQEMCLGLRLGAA